MKPEVSALLVHARDDRFDRVQHVLEVMAIRAQRLRTFEELRMFFDKNSPPHLILTDTYLPDGNWGTVLDLATRARERVNVIVVSAVADVGLYIDVMTHGAFDFATESFTVPELVHVLRCAVDDAVRLRPLRALGCDVSYDEAATKA